MRLPPTILIATLNNQEKQIILQKEHEFSGMYHVIIDDVLEAQVLLTPKRRWEVVPHKESWLTDDDCDVILQTVVNLENPAL